MAEVWEDIWEVVREKLVQGLYACLIIAAIVLLCNAIWRLVVYYLTRNRVEAAKQIYNAIRLGEPKSSAIALFSDYTGSKDQYMEEALLTNGKREEVLCLLFGLVRGEMGEIRLTYVDDRLVQKQQNGIW